MPISYKNPIKEAPPPLPDEDRSTKKVKIRGDSDDLVQGEVRDGISFKDKLLANEQCTTRQALANAVEFEVSSNDIRTRKENGLLVVEFSDRIHGLMAQSLKQAVVVRLLGRSIGYKLLSSKIKDLWQPRHGYKIIDLEKDYYMVKFDAMEDYQGALLKGPWSILGHYLIVQPWSPSFTTEDNDLSAIAAWVRFPGLPIQYYHKSVLCSLANVIRKPLKIDYTTKAGSRGKFACVAMELDLRKPLVSRINIDGRLQNVEYEDLSVWEVWSCE